MLGLLIQIPDSPWVILLGFVLMMAGIFTAQAIAGGVSGRGGSGVSGTYVAAFYLGGTVAGLVYPPFIGHGALGGLEAEGASYTINLSAILHAIQASSSLEVGLAVCVAAILLAPKPLR